MKRVNYYQGNFLLNLSGAIDPETHKIGNNITVGASLLGAEAEASSSLLL